MLDEESSHGSPKRLPRQEAGALLDLGFYGGRAQPVRDDEPGDKICRYQLVEPLGEGGFGVVWTARQTEPIQRDIALKLIKRGMDSREIIARFEAESQALARMDHPNIAAVLDAGTAEDGRPFFAMELVKGPPLNTYCDARKLCVRERLELFIPVCQAVQHAHQKSILHRDLKPSNILVAEVDGKAVPKVIDFGIAKALGDAGEALLQASLLQTRAGSIVGTLQYMSPEQAGSAGDVDTRSDIYSLGVILYELLTGQSPLEGLSAGATSYEELLRRIREEEVAKPSTRIEPVEAAVRGTDPIRLRRVLRGDLDWILLKALDKDRRRRYETATAFAQDLRRYLNEEPVSAAAPTWRYQAFKLISRNRLAFTAASVVIAALLIATAVSLWQVAEARKATALAEKNRVESEANAKRARDAVETYLNNVTENPELSGEEFRGLRRALLESAMPFYEAMAQGQSNDPEVRSDKAVALYRLGELHRESGASDKAVDEFRRAAATLDPLVAEYPTNPLHRIRLSAVLDSLARALMANGNQAEGLELHARALKLAEGVVKDFPENEEYRESLTRIIANLAKSYAVEGQIDAAEATMMRAIQMREASTKGDPGDVVADAEIAEAYVSLGTALGRREDLTRAERHFRKAMEIYESLSGRPGVPHQVLDGFGVACQNFSVLLDRAGKTQEAAARAHQAVELFTKVISTLGGSAHSREMLAVAATTEGQLLTKLNRREEAETALKTALAARRSLVAQFPGNIDHQHLESVTLNLLGNLRRDAKDYVAARDYYRASADLVRRAVAARSDSEKYQLSLIAVLKDLAEAHVQLGEWNDAVNVALELPVVRPGQSWAYAKAASVLARSIGKVGNDRSLTPEQRAKATEDTAAQAVELLAQSIKLGNPMVYSLAEDKHFERLYDNPAFRELVKQPAPPPDRSPTRFTLDYRHDDPGKRLWKREGDTWTETMPSGKVNRFKITQRRWILNLFGTEIAAEDRPISLFIPDKGSPAPMRLLFRSKPGDWVALGTMEDIE